MTQILNDMPKEKKEIEGRATVEEFSKVIDKLSISYRYKMIVSDSINLKLFVAVSRCKFGTPVYFLNLENNQVSLVKKTVFEQTQLNLENKFTKPTISALYYQPLKDWLTDNEEKHSNEKQSN